MLVPSASPPQQRDDQAPPHPVALRMVSRMSATDERLLSICISGQQLALLKKLDYPCSEAVLASAALIDDEGYELTGSRVDFEMLAGQYSFFLYLRDTTTDILVAQLFGIFESRPLGIGGSGGEFIGNDTFVNFISGPIELGTRYSTRARGSEGFHTQAAFIGLRSYRVEVPRAQLLVGLGDINTRRANAGQRLMSTNPADYKIIVVGALQEVFVEGIAGAEISMAVHARNLRVTAE